MTEQFWKDKYYEDKDRQKSIRMAQAVNLAQNELLQSCENASEVLEKIEEKSIKYYEMLEKLTNKLLIPQHTNKFEVPKIK